MATRASPTNTGYFLAGFNLVVILLLFALFLKQRENQAPEPVQLASGAWSPYSGEDLPEQGIATAMVVEVLKHMGQQVQLHFMPWEQAEDLARAGETGRDIRATFPYARVGVREGDFYFSLPILNVEQALFVHPEAFDLDRAGELMTRWENEAGLDWDAIARADLFHAEDREALERQRRNVQRELEVQRQTRRSAGLDQAAMEQAYLDKFVRLVALRMTLQSLNARILPISGYEYPEAFDGLFVEGESPKEDGLAAFARLREDQDKTRPLVVIEALRVARQLLLDHYPLDYLAMFGADGGSSQPHGFGRLPLGFESSVHLMAGKRNADNYRFIRRFDRQLLQLEAKGTLRAIEDRVLRQLERRQLVRLRPMDNSHYLRVFRAAVAEGEHLLVISGTEALVVDWGLDYLVERNKEALPGLIKVRINQGPHAGSLGFIDARQLEFP